MKNWIFQTVFYSGLFFPSIGIGQSLIKGNVYFFDSGESAVSCHVLILDSIKTDSIIPKYLNGIEIDDIGDFEGCFEVKVTSNDTIDLLINFLGYRNTIVKNVPNNADTIELSRIPLFIDDYIYSYETIVTTKKYLWGLFKRKLWYSEPMGTEGPFSYKDELIINCEKNTRDNMYCTKGLNGIEIEYNDLKQCGNVIEKQ